MTGERERGCDLERDESEEAFEGHGGQADCGEVEARRSQCRSLDKIRCVIRSLGVLLDRAWASGFSQKTSIAGSDVPTRMVQAGWHERSCNRVADRFDRSEAVSPTPPQLHVDSARELSLK